MLRLGKSLFPIHVRESRHLVDLASIRGNLSPQNLSIGAHCEAIRTISEEDVELFARVSGDRNPIHMDDAIASKDIRFGKRIAHGILCGSLVSALFAIRVPGAVYVSQEFQFKAPVYLGDKIRARIVVQRSIVRGRGTLLVCETNIYRIVRAVSENEDVLAISGSAKVMC